MELVLTISAFAAIAYVFARYGGVGGMVAGHCVVAVVLIVLDIAWVQDEIHKPDWNGAPDMDLIFSFGLLIRVFILNTLLLPISAVGMWLRERNQRRVGVNGWVEVKE